MQKWDLRGRPATAAIQLQQRDKIIRSQVWTSVVAKPLLWVIEQGIDLEVVGAFSGLLQRPHLFVCLVFRLLQILPKPNLVMELLRQDTHKYLRVLALCVIRLIGNADMVKEARCVVEEDYRKIRVQRGDLGTSGTNNVVQHARGTCVTITHVDEVGDELCRISQDPVSWLGLRLNPLSW